MAGKRTELLAEIAEGVLTIPGAEGRWHQRTSRTLYAEVSGLRLHRNVSHHEGRTSRIERLVGRADLGRDSLRLAGWGDVCSDLQVTVKPALPQEDGNGYVPFTCVTGFIPANPDFRTGDEWFLEAWLPPEDIERMVGAYRAGEMRSFTLGVWADLWMREGDEYMPPGYGVAWHMVPMTRPSDMPEAGRGQVRLVTWGEPAVEEPEPEPSAPRRIEQPETVAPVLASLPAADLVGAVERLRRTVVWVGAAIAAALVIGWFR